MPDKSRDLHQNRPKKESRGRPKEIKKNRATARLPKNDKKQQQEQEQDQEQDQEQQEQEECPHTGTREGRPN